MGSAQLHFARMLRLGELKVEAQMVKDDIKDRSARRMRVCVSPYSEHIPLFRKDKMDTQTASAHATITVEVGFVATFCAWK